jgi:hypothetical protein
MFASMVEGTNMVTLALTPAEWIAGSLATTPTFLYTYLYSVMNSMNTALSPTVIMVSSVEGNVLNSAGRIYFTEGIPGIDAVVPSLFQTSVSSLEIVPVSSTGALATELTITNKLGAQIANSFALLGTWLGISTAMAGGLFLAGICLFVMYLVYLYSGSTTASMLLAIPFLLIGAWSGLLPLGIMFTISIIVIAYMSYHLWLRGT